jgi:hypothetical protein
MFKIFSIRKKEMLEAIKKIAATIRNQSYLRFKIFSIGKKVMLEAIKKQRQQLGIKDLKANKKRKAGAQLDSDS